MKSLLQALLGLGLLGSWAYYLLCLDGARKWRQETQGESRKAQVENPERLTQSRESAEGEEDSGSGSQDSGTGAQPQPSTLNPQPPSVPPVSLLIPVRGADPEQHINFESCARLDYPAYQVVFGALDPSDPGLETARRVAGEHPGADIAVVSGGEPFGLNRKVCNLAHMLSAAKHPLLVLCDSDMRARPDYLRRVAAPFADPAVGLVTCLYRGRRARGPASMLEALGIGADFAPSVLAANRLEGMTFALGSTIALPRAVLDAIGGFEALADDLADDYLLGRRVAQSGRRVVLSGYVADDVLGRETLGAMWSRRLRWARTMRAMRPGGWAGTLFTHGTPLGLLFLAASGFSPAGWAALAATFGLRAFTAVWIARRGLGDENLPRLLPLLPLSDLLAFALWAASFCGRGVMWRGERYRVGRGGRLERA